MTRASKTSFARSFGAAADVYERARPGYPSDAVDRMLPPGARRVLDLGAGTGKFTRSLVERGLEVVAVEPLEGMRAELARVLPEVEALEGTAESIPLPDASVDVVTAAQAWHWVDEERAVPEVARVLRPGGVLSLVWNIRDAEVDWVRRLGRVINEGWTGDDDVHPDPGGPFGTPERYRTRWVQRLDRAGLRELVLSRSYIIVLPEAERAEVLRRVDDLLDTHPDTAGLDVLELPYATLVTRLPLR